MHPTHRSLKQLWGIFADLHLQQRGLDRVSATAEWIISTYRSHNVTQIICLGDVLNTRESVSVQALSKAADMFKALRTIAPVHVILGNHDMNLKHSGHISSLDFLVGLKGIHVYREPAVTELDGRECVMIPWHESHDKIFEFLNTLSEEEKAKAILFGHLEVTGAVMNTRSKSRYTGGPLSPGYLKPFQTVFLGHFHHHQRIRDTNAWYVGAPMQHHYGDANDDARGILLYDPLKPDSIAPVRHDFVRNPDADVFRSTSLEKVENWLAGELPELPLDFFMGKRIQVVCPAGSLERFDQAHKKLLAAGAESVVRKIVLTTTPLPSRTVVIGEDGLTEIKDVIPQGDAEVVKNAPKPAAAPREFSREGMMHLIPRFLDSVISIGALHESEDREEYASTGLTLIRECPNLIEHSTESSLRDFSATLKKVTVMNFLSVQGQVEIPFEDLAPGIRYIVGKNGSGKSLILEAIVWCLFGRLIRPNATAEGVVNTVVGKNCMVEVQFSNGYTIQRLRKFLTRGVKSVGVKVFKDGVEAPEFERGEVSASQQALERDILGCDYGIFTKCVMLGDIGRGAANFLNMERSERRSLLEEVLGFGAFDEVLETAKAKRKDCENGMAARLSQKAVVDVKLQQAEKELGRMGTEKVSLEKALLVNERARASAKVREEEFMAEKEGKLKLREESKVWHDRHEEVKICEEALSETRAAVQQKEARENARSVALRWIVQEDLKTDAQKTFTTLEKKLHDETKHILALNAEMATHYQHLQKVSHLSLYLRGLVRSSVASITKFIPNIWDLLSPLRDWAFRDVKEHIALNNAVKKREIISRDIRNIMVAKEKASSKLHALKMEIAALQNAFHIKTVPQFIQTILSAMNSESEETLTTKLERQKKALEKALDGMSAEEIATKAADYVKYRYYDPRWEKRITHEFEQTKATLSTESTILQSKLKTLSESTVVLQKQIEEYTQASCTLSNEIARYTSELKFIRFWEMAFERTAKKDVPNIREWLVEKAVDELNGLIQEKLDLVIGDDAEIGMDNPDSEEHIEAATTSSTTSTKRKSRSSSSTTTSTRQKKPNPKLRPENFQDALLFSPSLTLPPSIALLSSGQLKRCSISILLSLFQLCRRNSRFRPDFLFLDEAFDTLDEAGRRHAIKLLEEIVRVEGIRVAGVVSHNLTDEMVEGVGTFVVERGVGGTRIRDSEGVVRHS